MNHKHIISSWMALGLILFAIRLSTLWIINIFAITQVPFLSLIISGILGSFLFTYYLHGQLFTTRFKIKAIAAALALALIYIAFTMTVTLYGRLAIIAFVSELLSYGMQHFLRALCLSLVSIAALIITGALWYPFVILGNKLATHALKPKKN